jgi:hypothetical protein
MNYIPRSKRFLDLSRYFEFFEELFATKYVCVLLSPNKREIEQILKLSE